MNSLPLASIVWYAFPENTPHTRLSVPISHTVFTGHADRLEKESKQAFSDKPRKMTKRKPHWAAFRSIFIFFHPFYAFLLHLPILYIKEAVIATVLPPFLWTIVKFKVKKYISSDFTEHLLAFIWFASKQRILRHSARFRHKFSIAFNLTKTHMRVLCARILSICRKNKCKTRDFSIKALDNTELLWYNSSVA